MSQTETRSVIISTEAAKRLGIHRDSVRRLYNQGLLEGVQEGRDLFIVVDSLNAYKKNRNPRGRPRGLTSEDAPDNRASRRERDLRSGKRLTKAERLAAGEREREYQRNYQRERRRRLKGEGKT